MVRLRSILLGLFTACALVLGPATAWAQAASGANSSDAQMFVPTSAWLVGPATVLPAGSGDFTVPCVMMNQYNNGFIVRISGGGERVFAMAVDFRQDVFEAASNYDVTISMKPDFTRKISATAMNKGTILIDMDKDGDFYDALAAGKYLDMSIAGKKFEFALPGIRDGLQRMESCYRPDGQQGAPQHEAEVKPGFEKPITAAAGETQAVDPAYAAAVGARVPATKQADNQVLMPLMKDGQVEETRPAPQTTASIDEQRVAQMAQFAAKKAQAEKAEQEKMAALTKRMETLNDMIAQAEKKLAAMEPAAGTEAPAAAPQPQPQAALPAVYQKQPSQQPQVQQPAQQYGHWASAPAQGQPVQAESYKPSKTGSAEAHPIGKPLANTWMMPVDSPRAGMQEHDVMVAGLPPEKGQTPPMIERQWRAIGGTNLHEVLDVWAQNANARLAWKMDYEFSVQKSISFRGSFEEAVREVLEQYNDRGKRPVGRIFYDPAAHQKVLLVELKD